MPLKVGVIGAGVVGLSTALNIQRTLKDVDVTIVADKFNEETLSYVAAGIFRPSNSVSGPTPDAIREWTNNSYHHFLSILRGPEASKAGVIEISGYILSHKHKAIVKSHLLENLLPTWQLMNEDELSSFPGSWKYGVFTTTIVIECKRYLPWLMTQFCQGGGHVIKKHINALEDIADQFDIIVNCSGFSAKMLCQDHKLVPIRGQVFKVKAPWIKHFYYGDYDTYIIPGIDFVTLGGTRQYESYNEETDCHDSEAIWERCCRLVPSLKDAVVEHQFVGLRPHRDPVRIEIEILKKGNKDIKVVHNYGHGGYGVTLSWGSAMYATNLVLELAKTYQSKL